MNAEAFEGFSAPCKKISQIYGFFTLKHFARSDQYYPQGGKG